MKGKYAITIDVGEAPRTATDFWSMDVFLRQLIIAFANSWKWITATKKPIHVPLPTSLSQWI
jgi:hypothetical protein